MAGQNKFGTHPHHHEHAYAANFQGPLHLLQPTGIGVELVATHQDPNATLDLTLSAQKLAVDATVQPNTVTGVASFFSQNGQDALFCTFHGILTDLNPTEGKQEAFVHAVFTGGQGRFKGASGTGSVEAELFPSQAMSRGKIMGTVILP